ncbi:MAG: 40S ribosomal protein S19 [archaeon]
MSREIFSKDPHAFNVALVAELKNLPEIKAPEWSFFVKSGLSKQRVPESPDFWFIRTASILRQLYLNGVVGVERLRTRYGGRKNRGARPAKFKRASGKMIRLMLQQSEKAGLVEKVKDKQFGRRLTKKGRDFLDAIKVKEFETVPLSQYVGKERVIEVQEEVNLSSEQFTQDEE